MSSQSVSGSPDELPCANWIRKRDACRFKRGERHEKCCQMTLRAKRCLSFYHCPTEAEPYYGETNGGIKNICAAFDESPCFGNPRVMAVDSAKATEDRTRIFEYHEKAKRRVGRDRRQLRECADLSDRLRRCLRKNFIQL